MGMDVFGKAPKSEAGAYFRANIWSWRPIHELIEQSNVLPQKMVEDMSFNDGAGPGEQQALLLAAALESMLEGMDDDNEFMLSSEIDGPVAAILSHFKEQGIEIVSPRGPVYSATVDHVREFVTFCRESGGFEVW
jgi:trans-aconitate methyltransferase